MIREEGLDLVDVEYKKEGKTWCLRIFIDKAGGVTVDDCHKVSRQIEDVIEIDEIIPSSFILEVSSPGLDRPLKKEQDFLRHINKKVHILTYSPIDQRKEFSGVIRACHEQTLHLENGDRVVRIPLDIVKKARLILEF